MCTSDGKSELHTRLSQLSQRRRPGRQSADQQVRCAWTSASTGRRWWFIPEAVWYGNVKPEDAEEIVTEHLVGGRPVERLRIADECINTKSARIRS